MGVVDDISYIIIPLYIFVELGRDFYVELHATLLIIREAVLLPHLQGVCSN